MGKTIKLKNNICLSGDSLRPIIQQGSWEPIYGNCVFTHYSYYRATYTKIGHLVILTFHDRPTISSLSNNGRATISGLPFRPTWPQEAGGALGTCMITNTNYIPPLCINTDGDGFIELVNNVDGTTAVNWKTGNGGWIDGMFMYYTDY